MFIFWLIHCVEKGLSAFQFILMEICNVYTMFYDIDKST